MHRKATHNCYAYILRDNNTARHSDDGEPSGTAGVPIYEVLRKEGLVDVCCVVTRYFGGILLGAGGLVRAYSKGASDAAEVAVIKTMYVAENITLTADYNLYGKLAAVFAQFDARVKNEIFADNVAVEVVVRKESVQSLCSALTDVCNGRIGIEYGKTEEFDFGDRQ